MLYTFNQIPTLRTRVPKNVVEAMLNTGVQMNDGLKKTWPTSIDENPTVCGIRSFSSVIETNSKGELKTDEGVVFMAKDGDVVIAFGRMVYSNMGPTPVKYTIPVVDVDNKEMINESPVIEEQTLPFPCVESLFQWLKACCHLDLEESMADDVAVKIYGAKTPVDVQKAGRLMKGFVASRWVPIAAEVLEACILAALEDEATFHRYVGALNTMIKMLQVASVKGFLLIEANTDPNYGNNRDPHETLRSIQEHMAANPELNLIEAANQVNASETKAGKSGGKNLLGAMLTKILTEFQHKSHAEFLAAVRPAEENPAKRVCHGRSLTCPN